MREAPIPRVLYKLAEIEFRNREYLFRTINLYAPEDLIQEFWLRKLSRGRAKSEKLIIYDFFDFVKDSVRVAKSRLAIMYQNSFSSYFNEDEDSLFSYLEGGRRK